MSTLPTVEQRLAALEQSIEVIIKRLESGSGNTNGFEPVSGSMKDIPEDVYLEFLSACRDIREADRPVDDLVGKP